ncbi:MAG: TonB-dependent receptor [Prolixibacteraceae bacterium]|jgi:hypothetical protein|nr:TonB-dependent receptor [Prolixibacteraceae bacterium]
MKKLRLIFLLIIGHVNLISAQNQTIISGKVTELGTYKPIADCNIIIDKKGISKTTDKNGNFVIQTGKIINPEKLEITFSHIKYITKTLTIDSLKEQPVQLKKKVYQITDIDVLSAYSNNTGNKYTFTPLQAESNISVIGEPDIVRHLAALPGVAQGLEGTLGLFVRGSNNGGNRVKFNGVPLYSYSHLLGMFSSFSPDVIEKTTFRPGGIPIETGNLSSSLLQITTKKVITKPNNQKFSLSPYMAGGYISCPSKNKKSSIQIAARTSFMPFLINQFMRKQTNENEETQGMKGQILDVVSIIERKINSNNTIDIMLFLTNDYFEFSNNNTKDKINWGSYALKIGLNSNISPRLKMATCAYFNSTHSTQEQLAYDEYQPDNLNAQLRLGTELQEGSINNSFHYKLSNTLKLDAGFNLQLQKFQPASEKTIYTENSSSQFNNIQQSGLLSAFAGLVFNKPNEMELSVGYRHTLQRIDKQNRHNFDLRALGNIYLSHNLGIEVSLDRLTQYFHVLEGLPTGWSLNVLTAANNHFPEEITNQCYAGMFIKTRLRNIVMHYTIGGYYRDMNNLASYTNSVNMFGATDQSWKDEIAIGDGRSLGVEISGTAQSKHFSSTIAYTLSKTDRQFSEINKGIPFPFKFDRRHILNLQSKYLVVQNPTKNGYRRKQYLNIVFSYASGHRATLPVSTYKGLAPPYWEIRSSGWTFPKQLDDNAYHRQEMTSRNSFKMKDYLRLDVSYTFIKHKPKTTHEWCLSLFNVTNRQNPYLIFYDNDRWQQFSLIPIVMPSVRWSIKLN